jgi:3-phenylpropionate/trans-cinnamate dioxygenase ferredoxin reductase subunit
VHSALEQAKIAAATICGKPSPDIHAPWFWSDQYDVKLQIVGLAEGYDQTVLRGDPKSDSFAAFYLANGRLLAVDAVNRPREFMIAKKLVARGVYFRPDDLGDESKDFKQLAQQALAAADEKN